MRYLIGLILLVLIALGAAYVAAGRGGPPSITIAKPEKWVGASTPMEVDIGAPGAQLKTLSIVFEQNGKQTTLYSMENGQPSGEGVKLDGPDKLVISRTLGKETVPGLQTGPGRITATASRTALHGLRTLQSSASHDVQVRLERPQVSVVSSKHYINLGGSEMVVYRATPADVTSGVLVGDIEYPGYPASGASTVEGVKLDDPTLRIAFFALRYDQDLKTPIRLFARDEAGNTARGDFDYTTFPKPFKKSKIPLDDKFLQRVVPEILAHSPELKMPAPAGDVLPAFLQVNGELRRSNADRIAEIVSATSASRLWQGPFAQLGNSQVEASFADHRTYLYGGKEVDQQVHLGFDLAATAGVPVAAANAGKVLHAAWLGIYGNCVIVDHGMGVASLYGHLSSFAVNMGDTVTKGQTLGKSGMTGLAGGDHLHFTMLVNGRPVNPVEWWDPHWIQDRVDRKLSESAGESIAR